MMKENFPLKSDSFQLFNNYYDLLYHEKDYEAETEYACDILRSYNSSSRHLLELGFGTGNYSKHLSARGYKITGIEKSEHMVTLAKAKAIPHFLPIVDDITTFTLNKKFDAAISLFHVMSYLTKNTKVISCLKQVCRHLKRKGIFIFDVWYTPAVYSQQPASKVKHVNTDTYEITRIAEPQVNYEENIVEVNYLLIIKNKISCHHEVLKETHYLRHFSTPEIKLLANLSGFDLVRSEEFLTAKQPCNDTWGVCYILQKK